MNRGVEIDPATADDVEKSLIRTQVEIGVAARMACLEALAKADLVRVQERPDDRSPASQRPHPRSGSRTDATGYVAIADDAIIACGSGKPDVGMMSATEVVDCAGAAWRQALSTCACRAPIRA